MAQEPKGTEPLPESSAIQLKAIVDQGLNFLKTQGQSEDGTFSSPVGPGVTALVLTSMLRNDVPLTDAALAKGLKALEGFVKPDGGIYGNGRLKNYETCVGVLCFVEANKRAGDGRYNKILENAKSFLLTLQYTDVNSVEFGGVGYAGKGRPDLSNTAYLLEALHALKVEPEDQAVQRALVFISRCQNWKSRFNESELAAKVNDGGFFYTIPSEQELESADRNSPQGGLRSYGSMSYNGLKSMIYAGLKADDERVKAATDWIAKHYTLSENPGMGKAGLFYYFHTFGASLNALNMQNFVDSDGKEHAWKVDLIDTLAKSQQSDGSWQNENRQWFEDDKNLATAFALMALSYCRP